MCVLACIARRMKILNCVRRLQELSSVTENFCVDFQMHFFV
uniref:Uncharacterized protein n=1 Tax=Arundo donax TaxID=35708 RepID=A0A0A8XPF5_ARUDO